MNDMKHPAESHGSGFASTRQNPYSMYSGDFNSFFDFGSDYQQWVEDMMLRAIVPDPVRGEGADVADIGAGTCQWPVAFLRRQPAMRILAVEPSRTLAYDQCVPLKADGVDLSIRLSRLCIKAQDFAAICAAADSQYRGKFDCIYFMQSAHYIHHDEFIAVAQQLAAGLKPRTGRIVIQGRNMSAQWHPWPFPDEWAMQIQQSLEPVFGLADRYEAQLRTMNKVFHTVTKSTHEFTVRVSSESYWPRLAARWLPSVMSESTISDDLLRCGIDAMRRRYKKAGKNSVEWTEKFTMLSAEVI
jgi:SAM-dependent methyltransferase